MTPHVHMTYVSHFTQSHGQEKSSSYYDLFDFRVLFYGHIPTLIPPFFLHRITTPILTVDVFIVQANLQEYMTWTLSSDTIFAGIFPSIFDPTSLHIPYPTLFSLMTVSTMFTSLCLMPSRSRTNDKEHDSIGTTGHQTTGLLDY